MNRLTCLGLSVLACTSILFAEINLNSIYSASVQRLGSYSTKIDTLEWQTSVSNGVAQSKMTLVAKPVSAQIYYATKDTLQFDTVKPDVISLTTIVNDPIEMTLGFSLPQDFVVKNMWLWIDGKPVKALIQSKNLARQQYEQIVNRKKDPAILEYSTNGHYNLRVFPALVNVSRKVEIEFQHTFSDDSLNGSQSLITTELPVSFNFLNSPYYSKSYPFVRASFISNDRKSYTVNFSGVGSGTFSSTKELVLQSNNLSKLEAGVVCTSDPSGSNKYLWIGKDTLKNVYTTGLSSEITDASAVFENEPDTRIIVLDIRNLTWDWDNYYSQSAKYAGTSYTANNYIESQLWLNAQKYAILALRQYVSNNQKFNVLIGGDSVRSVFSVPVNATEENIKKAVQVIRSATPSAKSSTVDLVKDAIRQTPNAVVILISDLFQPYNYTIKNSKTISEAGKEFDQINDSLKNLVMKSEITLFPIDDNYKFYDIARLSGGYRLADLLYKYNVAYVYNVVNGKRVAVPQLPALFGSANYSGVQRITVASDKMSRIIYSFDTPSYYYGDMTSSITDVVTMPMATKIAYSPYFNPDNLKIRIAGQLDKIPESPLIVSIQGRMGGLRFKKEISAMVDYNKAASNTDLQCDVQYAFRNTEMLYKDNYSANAQLIKEVGIQYGIVTTQTSLLALEPGMKMWDDSIFVGNTNVSVRPLVTQDQMIDVNYKSSSLSGAPVTALGTGFDIESLRIEDLMNLNALPVFNLLTKKSSQEMSVSVQRNIITIRLPMNSLENVNLNLFDLKGRLVIKKSISANVGSAGMFSWNVEKECNKLGTGFYVLAISAGAQKNLFKVTLGGR